jgi:hypothetical protein
MEDAIRIYNPTPTMARFHASQALYRGIMGPVGSGKSTGCCMEVMTRAHEQAPEHDGVRRTRFAVVRNTYRELKDTTLKTWLRWFDEGTFGEFAYSDMIHLIRMPHGDGCTMVELEVLFRALDKPSDITKLLSLELTGAWVNEARELPVSLIEALGDRVERFPGPGRTTWFGVFMDTNPPDSDHWWYKRAEEDRPEGWDFFRQPGGLIERNGVFVGNPDAENMLVMDAQGRITRDGLSHDYYTKRMPGKSPDHIRVYYCAEYGYVREGKPVYPEFSPAVHVAPAPILARPGTIYVGLDFGLTPAATFGQPDASGRWGIIDELVSEDMGIARFGELLKSKMLREYPGHEWDVWGDPAGMQRAQTDERTPFDILRAKGIPARPSPSNDFVLRREAVAAGLNKLVDGKPGLMVSPKCTCLIKGMAGAYAFKRVQVSGDERFRDVPDKTKFSHVCESAQYLLVGAGEGRQVVRGPNDNKPRQERALRK